MADALEDDRVVVLRGHGLVSVGTGDPAFVLRTAVLRAVAVDSLARTTLELLAAGGVPRPISDEDLAALPDVGSGLSVDALWRHLERRTIDWLHSGCAAR